jgi:putative ABC transport system permease protein
MHRSGFVQATVHAARHAARALRHAPGFVALTTLTLAVGVGATTAIFSVVDAVLLRPLPYPDADELVVLRYANGEREIDNYSEPEYWDVVREIPGLQQVGAYSRGEPILGGTSEPERIAVVRGTASLLRVLGVQPARGRLFTEEEDVAGAARVVVFSHGLWTRALGADPAAVGGTVLLEDQPHTVVGVMPEGFAFPDPDVQAWMPLALDREDPWGRNNHYLRVVARLDSRVGIEAVRAQLDQLGARATELFPDFYAERVSFRAHPLHDTLVGDVRTVLVLVMGAVVGVLLIGAVNAASLFLARAERRRGEIAVRTALGAGRARVSAQLFFESSFVSLLAGASGMGLAWLGVRGLERLAPPEVPRLEQVVIDGRVLVFGIAITLATGILFGLAPAIDAWRSDVRSALAVGGRGGMGSRRGTRFRRALVVSQLAVATTLTLGSGLLLRSFSELRAVELGFTPEGTLVAPLSPANSSVAPDGEAVAFYGRLEDRLAALPGVVAVGSALRVPLRDGHDNFSIRVEGAEAGNVGEAPSPAMQWATPGFFEAMGIPLRAGRSFGPRDDDAAPLVAVVSESLATELWPGADPIGKRIAMWVENMPWMEVVGVAGDAQHDGVQAPASAMLYIPHPQAPQSAD